MVFAETVTYTYVATLKKIRKQRSHHRNAGIIHVAIHMYMYAHMYVYIALVIALCYICPLHSNIL